MEVSNINAFMLHAVGDTHHPSWIERDPFLRSMRIAHTLLCIDLAERLGVRTLSTEPGGPLKGMSAEEGLQLFTEGLLMIRDRAAEKRVRVLIEPEPGLLIESSAQFISLFKNLDPDVFGLNFDIGHFFCAGEDCSSLIPQLKDYIYHFHLEDIAESREHIHLMPGDGVIDLAGILKTIDESGYKGFVTVELYTYEDSPIETARKSLEYLNGLLRANKAVSLKPAHA
jgi:sugar phosphate isomerase/epimerase